MSLHLPNCDGSGWVKYPIPGGDYCVRICPACPTPEIVLAALEQVNNSKPPRTRKFKPGGYVTQNKSIDD